jgi:GNAT superfamily N-acetyltransferase
MLEIRVARADDDLARYTAVVSRVVPQAALTVAELKEIAKKEDLVHLIASADGETVGTGFCSHEPRMRARRGAFAKIGVLPERRNRGIGSALHLAVSDWARERGVEVFESNVQEDDVQSLAWAQRRGYEETSRELCVELDLAATVPPPVDPPPGIRILSWAARPQLARGMYEVACEAYPDVPGYEDDDMLSFEDWLEKDMRGPGDLPEATFVALAGDEVVGYAKFSLSKAQPSVAYHDLTGVKRAWRGCGVAGALKRTEIAWAKAAGYERLSATNEQRNEPIRRLNKQLGYRPAPGRIFVRGPLASWRPTRPRAPRRGATPA